MTRQSLPRQPHRRARNGDDLASLVHVDELPEECRAFVTLLKDGRQKKFELGNEGAPTLREVLSDHGQTPLSEDVFMERCRDRLLDIAARRGGDWASD